MKTTENKSAKKGYNSPRIFCIELDNDISLQLASDSPPDGPGEAHLQAPDYFSIDPFKANKA